MNIPVIYKNMHWRKINVEFFSAIFRLLHCHISELSEQFSMKHFNSKTRVFQLTFNQKFIQAYSRLSGKLTFEEHQPNPSFSSNLPIKHFVCHIWRYWLTSVQKFHQKLYVRYFTPISIQKFRHSNSSISSVKRKILQLSSSFSTTFHSKTSSVKLNLSYKILIKNFVS